MSAKGISRVVISVLDLEKAAAFYSKLLGCTFVDQSESAKAHGLRAMISWDGGIELIAPLPSQEKEFVEQHGQGVSSIIFEVDGVDAQRAEDGDKRERYHRVRQRSHRQVLAGQVPQIQAGHA